MSGQNPKGVDGMSSGPRKRTSAIPRYQGMYSTGSRNMSEQKSLSTVKTGSTKPSSRSFGKMQEGRVPGTSSMRVLTSKPAIKPNSLTNSSSTLGTKPSITTSSTSRLGSLNAKTSATSRSKNGQTKTAVLSSNSSDAQRNGPTPNHSTSRLGITIRRTSESGLTTNKPSVSKSTVPKTGVSSGIYAPRMTRGDTSSVGTTGSIHAGSSRRTSQTSVLGRKGTLGSSVPKNSSNSSLVSTVSQISQRTQTSRQFTDKLPIHSSDSSVVSSTSMRAKNNNSSENPRTYMYDRNNRFVLPPLSPRSNDSRQTLESPRPTSTTQEIWPVQSSVPAPTSPATYSRPLSRATPSLAPGQNSPVVQREPSLEYVSPGAQYSPNIPSTPPNRPFPSIPVRLSDTSTLEPGTFAPIRNTGVIRTAHTLTGNTQSSSENRSNELSVLLSPPPSPERQPPSDSRQTAGHGQTATAASSRPEGQLGNHPGPMSPNASTDTRPDPRVGNNELINTRAGTYRGSYPLSALPLPSSQPQVPPSYPPSQDGSASISEDETYARRLMEEELASIEEEGETLAQRLSSVLNTSASDVEETLAESPVEVQTLRGLSARVEESSFEARRLRLQLFLTHLLHVSVSQQLQTVEEFGALEGATAAPTTPTQGLLHMMSRRVRERNSDTLGLNRSSSAEDYMRNPLFFMMFLVQNHSRESSANHAIDTNDYETLWELAEQLGDIKKKGLTEEEIAQIPSREFIKSVNEPVEQCRVCLADYEEEDILRILPCQHEFHQQCIDQWLVANATCPICRNSMLKS